MKHSTLVSCTYNDETMEATVTKGTKWGTFTCSSRPSAVDKDIAMEYFGYELAEMKCGIESLKVRAQTMRERFEGARHLYDVMYMSGLDEDTEHRMYRQVVIAERLAEEAAEDYKNAKDLYKEYSNIMVDAIRNNRKRQERLHMEQ